MLPINPVLSPIHYRMDSDDGISCANSEEFYLRIDNESDLNEENNSDPESDTGTNIQGVAI